MKFDKRCRFLPFLTFFWSFPSLNWVSGMQTFPGKKKKQLVFFFFQNTEKKKQKLPKVSEWVPPNLFRGKKKNDTFG